jgi:hypothetical protein
MTLTCPKGHSSTESDFCSECGAKIPSSVAPEQPSTVETCPDCHTPRAAQKFCELCGYNYLTGAHGQIFMELPPMPPAEAELAEESWTVTITVDPALKEDGSPDPPPDWQPISIVADRDTLLIGRKSPARNIHPEIALDFDTAVSHRHALLTRSNGSGWVIRDIGSSNGTRLNGQDLEAMVDTPVKPGDRVTLGHWTCLTISSEQQS